MWFLLAVPALGIMVFMHELGHFLAAKAAGVGVEVFSLGWGPKLVGFSRGGTEYRLSWLPIGGFCKFKGDEGLRRALEQNLSEMPHEEGSFYSVPAWRRIIVVAAGPVASLFSAFLIFTLIWWFGFQVYSADNRIALATDYTLTSFTEPPPATVAGLATGDRITAIDGKPVQNFQQIWETVSASADRTLVFTVERAGAGFDVPVAVARDRSSGTGRIGVYSWLDPVVSTVASGSAAALAGLQPGDRIVRAGPRDVRQTIDLEQALADRPASLPIVFQRDGTVRDAVLVLEYADNRSNLGLVFVDHAYRSPRMNLGMAVQKAAAETWQTAVLTVRGIGLLFRGIDLREAVAGPIGIIGLIGTTAQSGFSRGFGTGVVATFELLAFLSVTLFLMNLLPLPALDGGQIVFSVVEIIRGRAVKPRLIWRVQMIGFSFLMVLFLVLTFNDLLKIGR
ncbi:MAG: RIP metalloprotease RseP [Spirochaetes bacterium]|nr:RIP metalloprotease RseP [Spirochaetota bacterium]